MAGEARSGESLDDAASEVFIDLAVPRDGLRDARGRVAVLIVPCPVAHDQAPRGLDRANEIDALHKTWSSSTLRIPASWPLVRSR